MMIRFGLSSIFGLHIALASLGYLGISISKFFFHADRILKILPQYEKVFIGANVNLRRSLTQESIRRRNSCHF